MRCVPLALACLLLAVLARPLAADNPPRAANLRSDIIYTTKGEFVQVSPMRALTLNAHVEQFFYDPLGLEIACVGSETAGDTTTHFVKVIDARTGHELERQSMTAALGDLRAGFLLLGWSLSGKYLVVQRFTPNPDNTHDAISEYLRWDLSPYPSVVHTISPETHLPPGMLPAEGDGRGFASPDRHWIVFDQPSQIQDAKGTVERRESTFLLYDPEKDTFRPLTLLPKEGAYAWSDNTHLSTWQDGIRKRFDVVTGELSPRTASAEGNPPLHSPHYPDLTVEIEHRLLVSNDGLGQRPVYIIWIQGVTPLATVAAGVMPSHHEPDGVSDADAGDDDPQAVWSPTGKQVAFIANSDLSVADLATATGLLPREKLAVGVKLTCPEERELAERNLKQIGLAIVQHAQDDDEQLPVAANLENTLSPYLKTHDVFNVDGHKFVYEQPADLSFAKMEDPAHTEQGYIDLPCARVVLMCDGHVMALPKAGNGGGGGE